MASKSHEEQQQFNQGVLLEHQQQQLQQTPLDLLSNCAIEDMANTITESSTTIHFNNNITTNDITEPETVFFLDSKGNLIEHNVSMNGNVFPTGTTIVAADATSCSNVVAPSGITITTSNIGATDDAATTTSDTTGNADATDAVSVISSNGAASSTLVCVEDSHTQMHLNTEPAVHIDGEIAGDPCMSPLTTEERGGSEKQQHENIYLSFVPASSSLSSCNASLSVVHQHGHLVSHDNQQNNIVVVTDTTAVQSAEEFCTKLHSSVDSVQPLQYEINNDAITNVVSDAYDNGHDQVVEQLIGHDISTKKTHVVGKRMRKATHKGEAYKKKVFSVSKGKRSLSSEMNVKSEVLRMTSNVDSNEEMNRQILSDNHYLVAGSHNGISNHCLMPIKHELLSLGQDASDIKQEYAIDSEMRSQNIALKKRKRRRIPLPNSSGTAQSANDKKKYEKGSSKASTTTSKGNGGRRATFCCIKCPETFTRLTHLKMHFRTHGNQEQTRDAAAPLSALQQTKKKQLICEQCGESFNTSRLLRAHEHRLHNMVVPSSTFLQCKQCSSTFTHAASFKVHMRAHRGEKPYQCTECNAEFVQSGHLMIHKRIHTGEKPYTCEICAVQFKQISHLKTHVRTHTRDKPYKCNDCDAAFAQNSSLKRHKRSHTGEKPYKCEVCDMTFVVKSNLQRHTYTHTGEKPYPCDQCSASFGQVIDLKRHKISHTGIKPYKCDLCEAQFSRNNNLKWHRLTHAEGATHKCEVCEVMFTTPGDLRFHKRSHEPPKPFQCNQCPASFQQNGSLNNHRLIHTREFHIVKKQRSSKSKNTGGSSNKNTNNKPYICTWCRASFCEKRNWKRHIIAMHTDTIMKEKRVFPKKYDDSSATLDMTEVWDTTQVTEMPKLKEENVVNSSGEGFTSKEISGGYSVGYENNSVIEVSNAGQLFGEVYSTNSVNAIAEQQQQPQNMQVMPGVVTLQPQQQYPTQLLYQGLPTDTTISPANNSATSLNVVTSSSVGAVIVNNTSVAAEVDQSPAFSSTSTGLLSQLIISTGPDEPARHAKPAGSCQNHSAHILTLVDATANHWQAWCLCESNGPISQVSQLTNNAPTSTHASGAINFVSNGIHSNSGVAQATNGGSGLLSLISNGATLPAATTNVAIATQSLGGVSSSNCSITSCNPSAVLSATGSINTISSNNNLVVTAAASPSAGFSPGTILSHNYSVINQASNNSPNTIMLMPSVSSTGSTVTLSAVDSSAAGDIVTTDNSAAQQQQTCILMQV
uniref:Zinc finger protein 813-like n=1 Tax=Hirondellea gigas TaxID=1518452 RepID=A0A6A7G017_9CRUS